MRLLTSWATSMFATNGSAAVPGTVPGSVLSSPALTTSQSSLVSCVSPSTTTQTPSDSSATITMSPATISNTGKRRADCSLGKIYLLRCDETDTYHIGCTAAKDLRKHLKYNTYKLEWVVCYPCQSQKELKAECRRKEQLLLKHGVPVRLYNRSFDTADKRAFRAALDKACIRTEEEIHQRPRKGCGCCADELNCTCCDCNHPATVTVMGDLGREVSLPVNWKDPPPPSCPYHLRHGVKPCDCNRPVNWKELQLLPAVEGQTLQWNGRSWVQVSDTTHMRPKSPIPAILIKSCWGDSDCVCAHCTTEMKRQEVARDHERRLATYTDPCSHVWRNVVGRVLCEKCDIEEYMGLPLPPVNIEDDEEDIVIDENTYYVPHMLGNLLYDIDESPAFEESDIEGRVKRRRANSEPLSCAHSKTWKNMRNDRQCVMCEAVLTNTVVIDMGSQTDLKCIYPSAGIAR